jgi:DJ-1/PfpI family
MRVQDTFLIAINRDCRRGILISASTQNFKENSMPNNLQGKTIAILATDGFEQAELTKPKKALEEAGARTQVVSPTEKKIKAGTEKIGATTCRSTFR